MSPLNGALGIIGATVMPHNLYLHSAISQTRKFDRNNEDDIANAVRFTAWDSNIQLGLAFVVNSFFLSWGLLFSNLVLLKILHSFDYIKHYPIQAL